MDKYVITIPTFEAVDYAPPVFQSLTVFASVDGLSTARLFLVFTSYGIVRGSCSDLQSTWQYLSRFAVFGSACPRCAYLPVTLSVGASPRRVHTCPRCACLPINIGTSSRPSISITIFPLAG